MRPCFRDTRREQATRFPHAPFPPLVRRLSHSVLRPSRPSTSPTRLSSMLRPAHVRTDPACYSVLISLSYIFNEPSSNGASPRRSSVVYTIHALPKQATYSSRHQQHVCRAFKATITGIKVPHRLVVVPRHAQKAPSLLASQTRKILPSMRHANVLRLKRCPLL